MARTLTDAVITLGALTDEDNDDLKTLQEGRKAESDYTKYLKAEGLQGKRIGYMKVDYNEADPTQLAMNTALDDLRELGAEIIELDEVVSRDAGGASYQVMLYEFKDGLNKYLESLGDNRPVKDLEDLIEQTFADSIEMRYHNHELLKTAQEKGDLASEDYLEALEKAQRLSREEGIKKIEPPENSTMVAFARDELGS